MNNFENNETLISSTADDSENDALNITNTLSYGNLILRNTLLTCSYCLIVLVSLCGNILVCKTIATQPKMRNSTNILITVLAISDLLMTTFNIPFTVVDIVLTDWIFGQFFCIIVTFVQANCVYVSSFTMALIAITRWRAVYRSKVTVVGRHKNRINIGLITSILIVWLLACIHSIPHTMFNSVVEINTNQKGVIRRCKTTFPDSNYNLRLWLTLETFVTQYVIPLSLSGVVYSRIAYTIIIQGKVGEVTEHRNKRMSEKKRRRIIMLILVVAIFALCWLPFNVYYLLLDFEVTRVNSTIFLTCHWLAMSSVCYNPFVYCWLNDNFREEAKKIIQLIYNFRDSRQPVNI